MFHRQQPEESIINYPALSLIPRPAITVVSALPCSDESIRSALKLVITSRQFSKAHRCISLLSYLVERAMIRSDTAAPPEQEIGVAVFGRDPNSYFPGDDPIVRVQAGRLRLRLAAYYADEGIADPLRITVPLGSYQARIALADLVPGQAATSPAPVLMFRRLVCLGAQPAVSFTCGLSEELEYRLYRDLSAFRLISPATPLSAPARQRALHVLEGTVRQDASRLRVSLHLRQGDEGTVTWYEQFDSAGDGSIAGQEQMAERCVQALQRHILA